MKIRFLAFLALALLFFLPACGEVGRRFKDFQELQKAQEKNGFVFLGRFDEAWPAEITEIRMAKDSIQFKRLDGTPHDYSGFQGYELKLIHLKGKGDKQTIVLFRSKEKKEE